MIKKASRVLIVDDMPINRMILSSMLATNGVLSDQAQSGQECLELCEKTNYDLILMDHRMPEMDGVDTFIKLKELFAARGRDIPVICHTTAEGHRNINLYKAAGFSDVLIKPIDPGLLSKVLLTYLPEDEYYEDNAAPTEEEMTISDNQKSDSEADTSDRDELDLLPLWLKTVPHIDLVAGIANCGTAEDYVDALQIFQSSVKDKSEELEKLFVAEDWSTIGLRVHSLKSMARLVGARRLAEGAALLEEAASNKDYTFIKRELPSFLASYNNLYKILSPIEKEKSFGEVKQPPSIAPTGSPSVSDKTDHSRCILLVYTSHGIVPKGIENQLLAKDFTVISIPDEPDQIITHRFDADTIIYFPDMTDKSHINLTTNLIGEICQDDAKVFCLAGTPADIEYAMTASGSHRVTKSYPRPVDFPALLRDMERFAGLEYEYHRKKMIYIVDDDKEQKKYLSSSSPEKTTGIMYFVFLSTSQMAIF
ncbi:MAG: response regulator [Butyrivibrio sp.]|nr:response regulator [Butyrivibrio sp.]